MEIRFCHLSDTHLGCKNPNQNEIRYQDFFDAFKKALNICQEFKPHFVAVTGDLFHHEEPDIGTLIECIILLRDFLENTEAHLILIPGTHDFPSQESKLVHGYCLDLLRMIDNRIHLIDDDVEEISLGEQKHVVIAGLRDHIENPYKILVDSVLAPNEALLKKARSRGDPCILLMHQMTSGMVGENRIRPDFDENLLEQFKFDYIGTGHNHAPWSKPQLRMYCPGSTEHTSIKDWHVPDRQVLLITLTRNDITVESDKDPSSKIWEISVNPSIFTVRKKITDILDLGNTSYSEALQKITDYLENVPVESMVNLTARGILDGDSIKHMDTWALEERIIAQKKLVHLSLNTQELLNENEIIESVDEDDENLLLSILAQHKIGKKMSLAIHDAIMKIQGTSAKIEKDLLLETVQKLFPFYSEMKKDENQN